MFEERLLAVALALPFIGSLAAAFLPGRARTAAALICGALALPALGIILSFYPALSGGAVITEEIPWLPSLGLNLGFRLTGFSWLFSLLILGIGALVILYARYYMSADDPVPRFFSFLMAFMGSMLGMVLSGNLIQLAFFWELTSVFSFLLIGYWHHNQNARDGARMSLIVTGTGGVFLLVGFLLLGRIAGSYDLDAVLAAGERIRASDTYVAALVLILIGAFTKSAQFPFHFWLPHAMAAPTPVSAYLHSATMVKAGVFVLALLWPVLAGTQEWFFLVGTAGLATLLIGAWSAIFQHDLKGLLAYSTISHLGLITLLLGMGTPLALVAAIFHMANHAIFKASLFMAAGVIDHEAGTRDLRLLSGLWRLMPITATLAMVAAAAMAGVPLLNGFLSKEMFLAETLEVHNGTVLDVILPYGATLASTFSVLYSLRFIHDTFFGPPPAGLPHEPHEAPRWLRLPIEILVLLCLVVGIFPALTIGPILDIAVHAVLGDRTPYYSLAIWHGFTLPLLMSVTALAGGAVLYVIFRHRFSTAIVSPLTGWIVGRKAFEATLGAIILGARRLAAILRTAHLQPQMRLLIGAGLVAGALPFLALGYRAGTMPLTPVEPLFAAIWLFGGAAAVGAAWLAKFHRLAAFILMGVAGLATCVTFVILSAPDLALTQLLVEFATGVLFLLSLRWLPKRLPEIYPEGNTPFRVTLRRSADLALAIAAGAGISLMSYAIMTRPPPEGISRFFLENAYREAGGTNVVNVMLVDFRAFDTMGEITVLCIVGLTVFSLLRRFRPARETVLAPEQQRLQKAFDEEAGLGKVGHSLNYLYVPGAIMQWMFPVIITFAVYLFLRGHDLPGGGFAAGVTLSIAIIVQYMAMGTKRTEALLRVRPLTWAGLGLLCSASTGAVSMLFGYPFLTTWFSYVHVPLIGEVPAASALIFDLGVFTLVVGATVLVLIALAHQSIRAPHAKPAPREKEAR